MSSFRVHIIHVGNMWNKGTQALLKADISLIKDILNGNPIISASTVDVAGVKKLNLPLKEISSSIIDIPYEKVDAFALNHGLQRNSPRYAFLAAMSFLLMFPQVFLTFISILMIKIGLKTPYRQKSLNLMRYSDVVVTCSDENFKEGSPMLPQNIRWTLSWWSMLLARTFEVFAARLFGKPVVMFPNSIGPFRTRIGRTLSRLALNCYDIILVRDSLSLKNLRSLGVKSSAILTTDSVIFLNRVFNLPKASEQIHPVIGVSPGLYSGSLSKVRLEGYVSSHAKALEKAISKYDAYLVFLPHYVTGFPYDDLYISKMILDRIGNPYKSRIIEVSTVEDFASKISQMDIVLSSKMHPVVFAVSSFVPSLSIAYDNKQIGFLEDLGLGDCFIRLNELTEEGLSLKIDHVWKNREIIKSILRNTIPQKQRNVRNSVASVLRSYVENHENQNSQI